jgi:phage N-6-adenine-methyltransferase
MKNAALFTSDRQDWETPPDLFKRYDDKYRFTLDVCATPENAKCREFISPEVNGLLWDWTEYRCWMNPPYGREIGQWVRKAYIESTKGAFVVALLPARTDTAWWHNWVIGPNPQHPYAQVEYLRGRIKFVGAKSTAPFPNAIAVYGEIR